MNYEIKISDFIFNNYNLYTKGRIYSAPTSYLCGKKIFLINNVFYLTKVLEY